jgi:hypothetical protein
MSPEVLEQLDLAESPLGEDLLAKNIGNLLDRDPFASLVVGGGADDAVGALAQLFGDGVALVDDEVLVEDFEDFAALEVGLCGGGVGGVGGVGSGVVRAWPDVLIVCLLRGYLGECDGLQSRVSSKMDVVAAKCNKLHKGSGEMWDKRCPACGVMGVKSCCAGRIALRPSERREEEEVVEGRGMEEGGMCGEAT